MANLMPLPKMRFTNAGRPLVGGKVFFYVAGTTTPKNTFKDRSQATANTNPVILDSNGEADIWLEAGYYKVVLKTSSDSTVWTQDYVSAPVIGTDEEIYNELITILQGAITGSVNTFFAATKSAGDTLAASLADGATVIVEADESASPTGVKVRYTVASGALTGAVIEDAAKARFTPAGVGAVARTAQDKMRDVVSVKDFGAVGDGVADDTAAIQAAINTGRLICIPNGIYKTTSPLIIGVSYSGLRGEGNHEVWGTTIDYYGADAAIKIFDNGINKRVASFRIEDLAIKVRTVGGKGIDFSHASYGAFKNIWIRLLESDQSGVYGSGNTLGSSPYYNQFDNIKIFGNANNLAFPNQRGFYFVGDGSGFGADGPNANIISNCGQISGVGHGVHVESGVGNLFSNIVMESIAEYAYRFGKDTTPAPGRADENMVVNHWMEGSSSCVFVRFEGDATGNSLTNFSFNSISQILWDNQSSSVDNFVKAKGNLYVVDFYGENIPASATTILSPTSPAWASIGFGGVIVPFRCVPYVMQVTAQNFLLGGLGTGLVRAYRAGVLNPQLQFVVQDVGLDRFGGKAINRTPDISASFNSFDGSINSQIEVTITTDAAWDQTASSVHVQVVFFG